jgi:hypothetical protein
MELILGYRQSGKTTKLLEAAINWQAEHEGLVFLTGGFTHWSRDLEYAARTAGMVDFKFVPRINSLRGLGQGLVAVDDIQNYGYSELRDLHFVENHPGCAVIGTYDITPKPFHFGEIEINPKHLKTGNKRADSVV